MFLNPNTKTNTSLNGSLLSDKKRGAEHPGNMNVSVLKISREVTDLLRSTGTGDSLLTSPYREIQRINI